MNILLVESHYRSRSWFAAIKDLEEIYILSVLPEERRIFVEGGIKDEKILNLHNPSLKDIDRDIAIKYMAEIEKKMSFVVNEIVRMDRTMRLNSYEYIIKYVYFIVTNIIDFLRNNHIELVFIEPTWTHEIVLCNICKYMEIPVLAPTIDKFQKNRLFMFHGYLRKEYFIRNENIINNNPVDEIISFVNKGEKNKYLSIFLQRNKLTFLKFKVLYRIVKLAFFGNANKNIQPRVFKSIAMKIVAIFRAFFLSYFNKFTNLSDIDLPYILVTLHVQPEAGIDVLGSNFSDQLQFVKQIARTTPANHYVLVKDHPHDFGRKKNTFYNELYKLPNIRVLPPNTNNQHAISNSELVISVAGTSSLEAAILGVPAVTAVEMWFKDLMVVKSFDPSINEMSDLLLKAHEWQESFDSQSIKDSLNRIYRNSFVGCPGDFLIDPSVLSDSNIENLKKAFSEVINLYK